MNDCEKIGMGWQPDMPDARDYRHTSPSIHALLATLEVDDSEQDIERVDLREFFGKPNDQHDLHCSTAQACIGLVEYFERRCCGRADRLSALFIYYVTRRLAGLTGNVGTPLRLTLKAIRRFGIPPTVYWPDDDNALDHPPDAFLYGFQQAYSEIQYVRLDSPTSNGGETLQTVRAFLMAGFPVGFGFSMPCSISQDADIPYQPRFGGVRGGQAVVAVGYDDRRVRATRGALLVRNSWGNTWGEQGYGWLPYSYVINRLASDFWTICSPSWLQSSVLTRPIT